MDKIRKNGKYIDLIRNNREFFLNYYYHSLIDLNLTKLDAILRYGILSKKLIEHHRLPSLYTHSASDFDSKNGNTFVSLSEYKEDATFNTLFESFALHTLSSLSILVDKDIEVKKEGERETYFDDEVFCESSIDQSHIGGILLPEHLSNMSIKDINPLPNDLSCFTKSYLNNWLKCTEQYFQTEVPHRFVEELKMSHESLWDILEEYERPERWVQSACQTQRNKYGKDLKDILASIQHYLWAVKYGIADPKYLEIIMLLNKDNLPVYEMQSKCLRKIN